MYSPSIYGQMHDYGFYMMTLELVIVIITQPQTMSVSICAMHARKIVHPKDFFLSLLC